MGEIGLNEIACFCDKGPLGKQVVLEQRMSVPDPKGEALKCVL